MPQFTRKQTTITAEQFHNGKPCPGVYGWEKDSPRPCFAHLPEGNYAFFGSGVVTIHGQVTPVVDGDWILPEADGIHFYPVKPDIFEAIYTPVVTDPVPDNPIMWNDCNKVVQDHRDGTVDIERTNEERAKRGLTVPWTPEIAGKEQDERDGIKTFEDRLRRLINQESMELPSDTPDFILAEFLTAVLFAFHAATSRRIRYYQDGTKIDLHKC